MEKEGRRKGFLAFFIDIALALCYNSVTLRGNAVLPAQLLPGQEK